MAATFKSTISVFITLFFTGALELQVPMVVQALPQFDDETYQKLMDDPRAQVETVYTSYAGITAARISSFISSLSSILIVVIIMRSATGLSTSYHRLVFGMSVADTIGSLAIFCSTWLMPTDMIYQQFEGAVYGTASTCTTQGFLFFTGVIGTFAFNTALCIYYASVIRFKISEEQFQKCVEPILFSLSIIFPFLITIPLVILDLFVPTPWDFTCTGETYPYWEKSTSGNIIRYALLVMYCICTCIIFSSMFIVCWTVYVQERILKKYTKAVYSHRQRYGGGERDQGGISNISPFGGKQGKGNKDNGPDARPGHGDNRGGNNHNNNKICTPEEWQLETKTIFHQALGYLVSFLLCQAFPFISLLLQFRRRSTVLQYLHVVLRPLQGFFNFLIFMGHKVCNKRRANSSLSRWRAFCIVFKSGREEPTLFIGNIAMVVKRGGACGECSDGHDMLDISFSDVRDTSASRGGGDLSTGIISIDPVSTTMRDSGTTTKVSHRDGSRRSETGLSYGESYGDNIPTSNSRGIKGTRGNTNNNADAYASTNEEGVQGDVFGGDNTSEGLEVASQSYKGASLNQNESGSWILSSWYSRRTPNSGDISHAVSSIDS